MTQSNSARNRRITIAASKEGIEIAEQALIKLGFDSRFDFAKSKFLGRNTVTKFFNEQLIQVNTFKKICEELRLDWRKIAAGIIEKKSAKIAINNYSGSDTSEEVEQGQTLQRRVTVIGKQDEKVKAVIVLRGDINSIKNRDFIQSILQQYSGDTIEITDIREGSIRVFISGSQDDIEQLVSRIRAGELEEVDSFPVEDVQILGDSSNDAETNELNSKWFLVQEIVTQAIKGRNLSNADLSDADLSGADLSSADLSGADLSGADLSGADLRHADLSGANLFGTNLIRADLSYADLRVAFLSGANLSGANLSGANLRGADLSDANLSGTDLRGADLRGADLRGADLRGADLRGANLSSAQLSRKVKGARFIDSKEISQSTKRELIENGAIFEDSPGDRESMYSPVNR